MDDRFWRRLQAFRVGADSNQVSFIDRLARENQWTTSYAERVYQEYLKFIYLAATGERSVTPSDQVDQVWHLHLCYSDSYWRELCGEVLGRKIHHGPTKGGEQESTRFWEQYEDTLARYTVVFGEAPPSDVWPTTAERFDRSRRFVRVDLADSLVVRKKTLYAGITVLAAALLLSGCEEFLEEHDIGNRQLLGLFVLMLFIWMAVRSIRKKGGDGGGGCNSVGGCSGGCGSGCGGGCGGD